MAYRRPRLLPFIWPPTMAGPAVVSCVTSALLLASAVPLLRCIAFPWAEKMLKLPPSSLSVGLNGYGLPCLIARRLLDSTVRWRPHAAQPVTASAEKCR